MMISTRGRYCLRVLIDLAQHEGCVPMKDVAARQGISLGYLEKILPVLVKNGVVVGIQGKGGGYQLAKPAQEITFGEILQLTEGSLAPVACLERGAPECARADMCLTLPVWTELERMVSTYLDSVTIAQVASQSKT